MQLNLVKIGNSRGIRLPASLIKECNIEYKVDVQVVERKIIISPVHQPRHGWAEAFQAIHAAGDDTLLIDDGLDVEMLEPWDAN